MSLEGLSSVASIGSSVASVGRSVGSVVQPAAPFIAGGAGAAGNIIAAQGSRQEAEFNARIADLESGLASQSAARSDLNAQIARNAAAIEASRTREAGRKVQGAQAAAAAKSGLVVTAGSPLLVMLETLRRSEEDAVLARWKGDVTATGLYADAAQKRIQAQSLQVRAQMLRAAGRRALLTGGIGSAGAAVQVLTAFERLAALFPGKTYSDVNYGNQTLFASNLRASEFAGYGYD